MHWYINDGRGPHGPLPEPQVLAMIASGQLRGGHVAQHGGQWMPMEAYPPFAQALHRARGGQPPHPMQGPPMGPPMQGPPMQGPPMQGPPMQGPPMQGPPMQGPPMQRKKGSNKGLLIGLLSGVLVIACVVGYAVYVKVTRPDKVSAAVLSSELSKDESELQVKLHIKTQGLEDVYVVAHDVDSTGSEAYFTLKSGREDLGKKSKPTLVFDVSKISPGKRKIELTVNARYARPAKLTLEIEKQPKLVAGYDGGLRCEGRSCSVALKGAVIAVTAEADTTLVVDGKKTKVGGASPVEVPVDFAAKLADKPTRDLLSASFALPIQLEFKDGKALKGDLQVQGAAISGWVKGQIEAAKKGRVTFAGDDAAPSKPRVLAYLKGATVTFFGSGTGMRSIDLVAIQETSTRNGSCGTYQNTTTGEMVTVGKTLYDDVYVVYDRRSGSVKSRRTITASDPGCPTTMSAGSDVSGFADEAEGTRFLESLVGG
jgi:hypothetical protein